MDTAITRSAGQVPVRCRVQRTQRMLQSRSQLQLWKMKRKGAYTPLEAMLGFSKWCPCWIKGRPRTASVTALWWRQGSKGCDRAMPGILLTIRVCEKMESKIQTRRHHQCPRQGKFSTRRPLEAATMGGGGQFWYMLHLESY